MASINKGDNFGLWFSPGFGDENRDVATEAFKTTVKQLELEVNDIRQRSMPFKTYTTIHDIQEVITQAKSHYESKPKSRTKPVREWLEKLSCRVMHYSRAFDTIASHHQEYVALAWGAIKLVLTGIINHAELVQRLSEALVAIADVLPRAELNAALYPTRNMESALTRLYTHITLFAIQCVQWYKRSPAGRFWSAIKDPFELQYKDLLKQIKLCSQNIDSLADAGLRAETRYSHDLLIRQEGRLIKLDAGLVALQNSMADFKDEINHLVQIATLNSTTIKSIDVSVCNTEATVQRIELAKVLKFFTPRTLPDTALLRIRYSTHRNPAWSLPSPEASRMQQAMNDWAAAKCSRILVVRAGLSAQQQAKVLANDIIRLLNPSARAVFWSVSAANTAPHTETMADVLKSVIFQALHQSTEAFGDFNENLNLSKIHSPHNEDEWASLLGLLLSRIPEVFLVIETHSLSSSDPDLSVQANYILKLLQVAMDRAGALGSRIKLLLILSGRAMRFQSEPSEGGTCITISLQPSKPVPPRMRHLVRRGELHLKGQKPRRA